MRTSFRVSAGCAGPDRVEPSKGSGMADPRRSQLRARVGTLDSFELGSINGPQRRYRRPPRGRRRRRASAAPTAPVTPHLAVSKASRSLPRFEPDGRGSAAEDLPARRRRPFRLQLRLGKAPDPAADLAVEAELLVAAGEAKAEAEEEGTAAGGAGDGVEA